MADHGGYSFTAEQPNSVVIPAKLLCSVCSKWKAPVLYSNKFLNIYRSYKLMNPSTKAVKARLRCRVCTGGQVTELECEGQCGMYKDISQFSKNTRRMKENICVECTLWKESLEPGMIPTAAPNTELAPDEEEDFVGSGRPAYSDPEDGDDDDEYEVHTVTSSGWGPVPIATPSNATAQGLDLGASLKTGREMTTASATIDGPPMKQSGWGAANVNTTFHTSNTRDRYIDTPFHAMLSRMSIENSATTAGQPITASHHSQVYQETANAWESKTNVSKDTSRDENQSESSVSNLYDETRSNSNASVWTAIDAKRALPILYNAYGPNGQHEIRAKYASGSEISSQAGGSSLMPAAVSARRRNEWAKPVGSRTTRYPHPAPRTSLSPKQTVAIGDYSESEDE